MKNWKFWQDYNGDDSRQLCTAWREHDEDV